MNCPKCGSAHVNKNGHCRGKQNYRCKVCGRQFVESRSVKGYSEDAKQICLKMYRDGAGFRAIERTTGISHNTIINWVKQSSEESEPSETDEPLRQIESLQSNPYNRVLTEVCRFPPCQNAILCYYCKRFFIEKSQMNLEPTSSPIQLSIEGCHRWQVYHRLCELEIACSCTAYRPLSIQIESAIVLVQFWSVMRQATHSRQTLVNWLERCWRYRV